MSAVDALQRKISRLSQTVRVSLQTSEERRAQSQGSSLGIATGGPGGQAAAAAARVAQKNTQELQKQLSTTKSLATAADDYQDAVGKAVQQNNKIRERLQEQEKLQQRLEKLRTQTNRKMAANLFGAGTTNEEAIKRTQKELNGVRTSLRNLQTRQEGYNKAVRDGIVLRNEELAKLAEINGKLRRAAQLEADGQNRLVNGQTFDERLAAVQARGNRRRSALRGAGVGAGAAALQIPGVSGIASGALAGAAVGGPVGAAAGAAVAGVTQLTAALASYGASAATAAAETQSLQIALGSVVGSQGFGAAVDATKRLSDEFNTGIGDVTKQFTQLAAAVKANGGTVKETEGIYKGLAAANAALGGSSQDLQGILRATTQVLSKGKVQAEELRGQIGERLPGAFALFAKSQNLTLQQLDKALEQGKVSSKDFVDFAVGLYAEYADAAKAINEGPAKAGDRLKKDLENLAVSVGNLLLPIGAAFQDTFGAIVRAITAASNALAEFLGIGLENAIAKSERALEAAKVQLGQSDNPFRNGGATAQGKNRAAAEKVVKRETARLAELRKQQQLVDARNQEQQTKPTAVESELSKSDAARLERQQQRLELSRIDNKYLAEALALQERRNELTDYQYEREVLSLTLASDLEKIEKSKVSSAQKLEDVRKAEYEYEIALSKLNQDRAAKQKEAAASLKDLINEINNGTEKNFLGEAAEAVNELSPGLDAANQAGQELYRTFENLIFATENWADTLTSALKALSSILIKFALGGLAGGDGQGLFSFLNGTLSPASNTSLPNFGLSNPQNFASAAFPGRASGGGVSGGKPYVVGEQGSELFIPGKSGTIVPSDVFNATRAAMSNSATQGGDSDAFDQNAVAMGTSASIVKEKSLVREMAARDNSPVDIKFDSTVINNVEYVTAEQFMKGMAQSVNRSRAAVFRDLKNKPSSRAGIGI